MSRNKKRRRRLAGRHRKLGVDRKPSGQIRRQRDAGPTPEALSQRARLLKGAQGVDRQDLMGPDAGWPIGRLYLAGLLTDGEGEAECEQAVARRDAAYAFWKTGRVYASLLLAPRQPSAIEPGRPAVGRTNDDNQDQFVLIKATYDASVEALAEAGHDVLFAVSRAVNDQQVPIEILTRGLDVLASAATRKAVAKRRADALQRLRRRQQQERNAAISEPIPEPA